MHSSTSPQTPQPNSKWHYTDEANRRRTIKVLRIDNGIVTYMDRKGRQAMLGLDLFLVSFERGA